LNGRVKRPGCVCFGGGLTNNRWWLKSENHKLSFK
jgi:hypothetical protein